MILLFEVSEFDFFQKSLSLLNGNQKSMNIDSNEAKSMTTVNSGDHCRLNGTLRPLQQCILGALNACKVFHLEFFFFPQVLVGANNVIR